MSEYKYLITLKPLEAFFFGGELTFGADESRGESSRYSAKSTYFPQQTALLGMLRKTMLIQNGNLTMHKKGEWVDSTGGNTQNQNYDEAKVLTGTEAFSYEHEASIGTIKNISPLFIKDKNEYYIVNAKDASYEAKELSSSMMINGQIQKTIIFEGFDPKAKNDDELISQMKTIKKFSDVFSEVVTVGIKKTQDGATEEDAFFQKTSYRFEKGEVFAFEVTLSEAIHWTSALVTLGADQSSFMMKVERLQTNAKVLFSNIFKTKNISRVILTSEAKLNEEIYNMCKFVFGKRESFRQLTNARKGRKSKRYYLLERGSVLYTDHIDLLEEQLNQQYLKNAGINHYITLKGKSNV